MGGRDREVDHDVHPRVLEDRLERPGDRHAMSLGLRCRPFGVEVADGDDLDIRVLRKVRQVLGRDGSGSGQADPDRHQRALR